MGNPLKTPAENRLEDFERVQAIKSRMLSWYASLQYWGYDIYEKGNNAPGQKEAMPISKLR